MSLLIGENIKRLRKEKDVTQEQLATAMDVTCAAVSKWERGETYPDITLLAPLAFYFSVSIDELMDYDEAKIKQEIECMLSQYRDLRETDPQKASKLIVDAYEKFPNDYKVMSNYMWNIGGDYADNNPEILLKHKEEFNLICQRILTGCTNNEIRLNAYNMLGKLLWAEGKTDEALELYKKNFANWHTTIGQKSEQLFLKDTPEFLYWVRKNMYELIIFTGDKLTKSIFYDTAISFDKKIKQLEFYCDKIKNIYDETNEICFLIFAGSVIERLDRLAKYYNADLETQSRIEEKCENLCDEIKAISYNHKPLKDINK